MTVATAVSSAVKSLMLKEPARNSVARGSTPEVRATVEAVIADIRERGDEAVREYSQKFDKYAPESLRTVTYQEVTNTESSAFFGELCGRASRVERFEGHARSGDVRAAKYRGTSLPWSDHEFDN